MATLQEQLVARIENLEARVKRLERIEFAIMQSGDGAPAHNAVEGTLYWDYTNDWLYVNDDGAANWTQQ